MFSSGFGQAGDVESLARQYWDMWSRALRQGGAPAAEAARAPGWDEALQWWSQLLPQGPSPAAAAVDRFNRQARDWYARMQQVAAQFAGADGNAADIGAAWREALGATAEAGNPFSEIFRAMRGWGQHGLDGWIDQAMPYLKAMQATVAQEQAHWLQLPAFGPGREHQERWQALALAYQDYQQRSGEYNALMLQASRRAFDAFEARLAEHEQPGRQIGSARALFDLWIDAAEEAYAKIALSAEFRHAVGALGNAQMRLRAAVQKEVEQVCDLFGVPSRTEVDAAHRKIAELERALRKVAGRQAAAASRTNRTEEPPADPAQNDSVPVAAAGKDPETEAITAGTDAARSRRPARQAGARTPAKKPMRQAAKKQAGARPPHARRTAAKTAPAARRAVAKRAPAPAKVEAPPRKPRRSAAKKAGAAKPAPHKPAKKGPATAAPTRGKTPGNVVSMKEWVARYAAAGTDAQAAGKPGAGRGKRGGGR